MKAGVLSLLVSMLFCVFEAHGENIIRNGDFSLGNTNFISDYTYVPYNYADSNLTATVRHGRYTVAPFVPPSFSDWPPFHTVSGGNSQMLVVNGATAASKTVWSQSIPVVSNTTYFLSFYLAEIGPSNSVATNAVYIGTNLIGIAVAPSAQDVWQQFSFNWNSGTDTNVLVAITDLNIQNGNNDFAIDNISMSVIPSLNLIYAGENVILMWPADPAGFTLQCATNLAPPAIWNTVSPSPAIAGATKFVTNSVAGVQKFYRLSR